MHYFAIYENEQLISVSCSNQTSPSIAKYEISAMEYEDLLNWMNRKNSAISSVLALDIPLEAVDEDIRERVRYEASKELALLIYSGETVGIPESIEVDVQTRIDELIAEFGPIEEQEITDSEALDIILGGETA